MSSAFRAAIDDILASLAMWRLWMALAQEDIGDQHRRTTLGPLWLLMNYLLFAGTFIFLFHRGAGMAGYAAYVATGLLVWFYIMETLNLSVTLFVREESFIKGTRLPLSVYIMRLTLQSLIRNVYAMVGCLIVLGISGTEVTPYWFGSLLGISIIVVTTPAAITVFAFLGAYFPDSQYIVSNLLRIGLFITPVFWSPESMSGVRALFYWYDPFTYFLEIVRVPIIAGDMPWRSLALCSAISVMVWALALTLFTRLRRDVVFVL